MTFHYHGTPITPTAVMLELAGANFCVSHFRPDQVELVHKIAQSVMLDNGAFSAWRLGKPIADWKPFYAWADQWLDHPTTWAVIPDEIDAGSQYQDALVSDWPHGDRGAPVWHMDEPLDRLLRLLDTWPRVCIGSTAEYAVVLSPSWQRRMDEVWREIAQRHRRTPWIHMLRGMQLATERWPFASLDSTDIARNHSRHKQPVSRLERWDAAQCPSVFTCRGEQMEFAA